MDKKNYPPSPVGEISTIVPSYEISTTSAAWVLPYEILASIAGELDLEALKIWSLSSRSFQAKGARHLWRSVRLHSRHPEYFFLLSKYSRIIKAVQLLFFCEAPTHAEADIPLSQRMLSIVLSLPNICSLDLKIKVPIQGHNKTCHIETQFFGADYSHLPLRQLSLSGRFRGMSLQPMMSKFFGQLRHLSVLDLSNFTIQEIGRHGLGVTGDVRWYKAVVLPRLVDLRCASITDVALTAGSSLEALKLHLLWNWGTFAKITKWMETSRESLRVLHLSGGGWYELSNVEMVFAIGASFPRLREFTIDLPLYLDSKTKFSVDMEHVDEIFTALLNSTSNDGLRGLHQLTITNPPFTTPARKRFIEGFNKIFGDSIHLKVYTE